MAINKNHEFGDLNGMKCAIIEKNITIGRVDFLKKILEFNHYTVVIVSSAPLKTAPVLATVFTEIKTEGNSDTAASTSAAAIETISSAPLAPETFTLGVTDATFNATNAIFGRLLKTPDGHIVTQAYWLQKEPISHDEVPYYEKRLD